MRVRGMIFLVMVLPVIMALACGLDQGRDPPPEINALARSEAENMTQKTWTIVSTSRARDSQRLEWIIRSGNEEKTLDIFLPGHAAGWTYLMLNTPGQRVQFDYRDAGYSETGVNLTVADFLAPVVNRVGPPGSSSAYKAPFRFSEVAFSY